jgi:hypothetical protein
MHLQQSKHENPLDEWRRLLRASVTQGRAVLQRVLRGPHCVHTYALRQTVYRYRCEAAGSTCAGT